MNEGKSENTEIRKLLKYKDDSLHMPTKTPSYELINLMKDAASEFRTGLESSFQTLAERWAIIKKKGMAKGFTEQEMQEFMKVFLKDILSNSKIKYLFNPDYYKDKSKLQYEKMKLANISQNVDKNDTEQLSINSSQQVEGLELSPELDLLAEIIGLSREKKKMIANKRLKDHPMIQKELIEHIKDISNEYAQEAVAQTIMDLETGVIEDNGDGSYVRHTDKRDKIQKKPKTEYAKFKQFELVSGYYKFMKLLTGLDIHELEVDSFTRQRQRYKNDKSELSLSEIHEEEEDNKAYDATHNTVLSLAKKHQLKIIKIANSRQLTEINNDLIWLIAAAKQMYNLTSLEFESREAKKELTKE